MIGKKVRHSKYGKGEVVNERYFGYEYYILFENGIKRWVRFDEIEIIEELEHLKDNYKDDHKTNLHESYIIEALRLGIVPGRFLREITYGREKEIEKIKDWLFNENRKSFFIIYGNYGSGKTHLANYIESLALEDGFATSFIEIDSNESSFSKPKLIYKKFVSSLKCYYNKRIIRFRDIIREAIKGGYLKDNKYFRYLYSFDNYEEFWEWLEARDSGKPYMLKSYDTPSLLNYFTSLNVYCYLISSVCWIICNVLKLKGLLIIFDEAENINRGYDEQINKNFIFIDALDYLTKNYSILTNIEGSMKLGLPFPKNSPKSALVPYVYRLPFNLKIIFTFTHMIQRFESSPYVELEKLSPEALRRVFWKIWDIYKRVYKVEGVQWQKDILEYLINNSGYNRKFIKGTVEAFDLIRFENKDFLRRVWK